MEKYKLRAGFNGDNLSPIGIQPPTSFQPKPPPSPQVFSTLPPKPPISSSHLNRREEAELSIFDAQRYFNEEEHQESISNARRAILLSKLKDSSRRSFHSTPTVSSEASWNSQSGLLSHRPGSLALSVRSFPLNEKKTTANVGSPNLSTGRKIFGRNPCPCYGKKAVAVAGENPTEPNSPVHFRIRKLSTSTSDRNDVEPITKMKITAGGAGWETFSSSSSASSVPHFPSAVIGSHRIVNSGRPFVESSGFSFPMLATPRVTEDQARDSMQVLRPVDDDDVASDTSSDLFELESFSTNSALGYRRRDSLDELVKRMSATITPSECYAPSEVSVEWSVTTAEPSFDRSSLANFSSAASDCGDFRFAADEPHQSRGDKKKGSGGLLSCRCENAVNVGPAPVRIVREQRQGGVMTTGEREPTALGRSRFAQEEKAELIQPNLARLNRQVHIR